jgi:hypothetical protein
MESIGTSSVLFGAGACGYHACSGTLHSQSTLDQLINEEVSGMLRMVCMARL